VRSQKTWAHKKQLDTGLIKSLMPQGLLGVIRTAVGSKADERSPPIPNE